MGACTRNGYVYFSMTKKYTRKLFVHFSMAFEYYFPYSFSITATETDIALLVWTGTYIIKVPFSITETETDIVLLVCTGTYKKSPF